MSNTEWVMKIVEDKLAEWIRLREQNGQEGPTSHEKAIYRVAFAEGVIAGGEHVGKVLAATKG